MIGQGYNGSIVKIFQNIGRSFTPAIWKPKVFGCFALGICILWGKKQEHLVVLDDRYQRFLDASRLVFAYSEGKSKNIWSCSTTVGSGGGRRQREKTWWGTLNRRRSCVWGKTKGFWVLSGWYLHSLWGKKQEPLVALDGCWERWRVTVTRKTWWGTLNRSRTMLKMSILHMAVRSGVYLDGSLSVCGQKLMHS